MDVTHAHADLIRLDELCAGWCDAADSCGDHRKRKRTTLHFTNTSMISTGEVPALWKLCFVPFFI